MYNLTSRPRLLLRRLHKVMAGAGSAQSRLNKVVKEIARNMVAEVCSVYLARSGGELELFATEGLKPEAVHQTRLKFGEGLVGLIAFNALPLNLPEASTHPSFVYRPETGEEIYHSLLGVPLVRHGRVVGVLVVQNKVTRRYSDEEVEALQTISMVLAELVGTGDLLESANNGNGTAGAGQSLVLDGQKLADGIASGAAVFHEPKVEVTQLIADDAEQEISRLQEAFDTMRRELDRMMSVAEIATAGEHRDILETYKMFAYDRGWQRKIKDAIQSGLTAEAAVERVQQDMHTQMMRTSDPYLRERLSDFDDLAHRLIRILAGRTGTAAEEPLKADTIIIAKSLGPSELLDYDRTYLKGIALEEGSPTAHVTIIARAMGIPMIGRVRGILSSVEDGENVIVDCEGGHVFIRPTDDIVETYQDNIAIREARVAEYAAQRHLPAISRDGVPVQLLMNGGLLIDLPNLDATGAGGIGLFRTEFQFMVSSTLPRLDTQMALYREVMDAAGDKPVIFRTLDLGGDKSVPFLPHDREENPALGWRAIRVALDRPALLRYQIRALLMAATGRCLNIMFPMIADVSEVRDAKDVVAKEVRRLEKLKKPAPAKIRIGCMLEVPSLAWQMNSLLPEVDFISIGTNDLMQFFFASDRANPRLADRYDLLSPAALSLIQWVVKTCNEAGVPVTLCGEMGSRPLEAMALMGLGLKRLSISPSAIGPVRTMVRSLDVKAVTDFLLPLLNSPDHSLREKLRSFAKDHAVII